MERPADFKINLLQPKTRPQGSKMLSLVIILLALTAILFNYYYLLQSRAINSQQVKNMQLKAEIKGYENENAVLKPMQAMEQELTIKSEEIAAIEKVPFVDVMNELGRVKPPPIIIVEAEIKPPLVVVNGFSPDYRNVSQMLEGIKSSPIFTKVALLSSDMNESTNEVKFTVEVEWEASPK